VCCGGLQVREQQQKAEEKTKEPERVQTSTSKNLRALVLEKAWQRYFCKALSVLDASWKSQMTGVYGRAYSHRIPLAGLKRLSEMRQKELAARLGESRAARGD